MELYLEVRLAVLEGMTQLQAAKHFNISRDSVAKMVSYSTPPGYQRQLSIRRPNLGAFVSRIEHWLGEDLKVPRKQRHTAKRVFDRVRRGEIIGRHPRCWEREDVVFDPVHDLPLIEQKINALYQAAPLQGWDLPEEFTRLRRLMEGRMPRMAAGIRAGSLPAGELRARRPACGGETGSPARSHRLKRRQASDPVPSGAPTASTGPIGLPLTAEGDGRNDVDESVYAPHVVGCGRGGMSTEVPEILLSHYLKILKLPTFQREYQKLARLSATEGVDHVGYLFRLAEREMIEWDRRKVERRTKAARFSIVKSLDSFHFAAIPKLNKMQVLELARCEWIERRENVIALGPSGTGKTHVALGRGLAACQKGMSVGFPTAASLVSEMMEPRDERRLLRFQKQMAAYQAIR